MTKKIGSLIVLTALSASAGAVTYVPVGIEKATTSLTQPQFAKQVAPSNLVVRGWNQLSQSVEVKGLRTDGATPQYAECATPPTDEDIGGSFEVNRYVMTRSGAASLGIVPGVGKADIETTGSQLVAIFDFSRTKSCLAPDGKTGVIYGQTIRTVTSFESSDVKANVTFPLVAATATVAGKTSSVNVKNIGFNEPTMAAKAAELSLMELSVENFDKFRKLYSDLTALATSANTQRRVEKLGIVPAANEDELVETLPAAFAIQQIKDGRSCEEAKLRFRDASVAAVKALTSTYISITTSCSAAKPNAKSIASAKDYLQGMKVSN